MTLGKRDGWIALIMLIGVAAIHWPAHEAGFVSDFMGWEREYREQSFWAFLTTFGHPVHQQLPQFFNILLYKAFGAWGLPWYLLFCSIHAANGFLLYRLLLKISALWQLKHGAWLGITGALFFLFSPYITDATVWRVCLHYLMSGAFTLGALIGTADYLERGNRRSLWLAHGLLLLNFFTLELALAIPLLTHALCIGWWLTRPENQKQAIAPGTFFRQMTLPQLGIGSLFFLLNKLTFGQWVGHYGEATHLKFDALKMLAQPMKYAAKYATFGRHFEHADKAKMFGFIESERGLLICYGLFALLVVGTLCFKRKSHPRLSVGLLLFSLGLLATLPVSNLHFEWILFNELDRYGYVASLFFLSAIAVLFSAIPGRWKNLPSAAFLLVSIFFLFKTMLWWRDMENCYRKLLQDFKWYDKREIFVLATADNYQGIWVMRSYRDKPALQYALELLQHKPLDNQFHEVAQYNMNSLQEGLTATIPDTTTGVIRVEFDQWGNWWWKNGRGANDYQNDLYKVVFKGKWYELTLKNPPKDAVFIYQSGDSWKVLELPE
jgi:hypothetical protein